MGILWNKVKLRRYDVQGHLRSPISAQIKSQHAIFY